MPDLGGGNDHRNIPFNIGVDSGNDPINRIWNEVASLFTFENSPELSVGLSEIGRKSNRNDRFHAFCFVVQLCRELPCRRFDFEDGEIIGIRSSAVCDEPCGHGLMPCGAIDLDRNLPDTFDNVKIRYNVAVVDEKAAARRGAFILDNQHQDRRAIDEVRQRHLGHFTNVRRVWR